MITPRRSVRIDVENYRCNECVFLDFDTLYILFYEKDLLEIMCHMKEDTRRIKDEDQLIFWLFYVIIFFSFL